MKIHEFLKVALAVSALVLMVVPDADAQRRGGGRDAPEQMFPEAERQEPRVNMTQRVSQRLERLHDRAGQGTDPEGVIEAADELINDERAGDYARAFASILKADALDELDRSAEAIAANEQALEINGLPNNQHYQVMLRTGQMLVFEERYDEGIAMLQRFFNETRSGSPDQLALMGNAYYQSERYAEAADYLQRAIAAHDNPPDSWRQVLMASYDAAGDTGQAVEVARASAEASPDDKRAQMNYAAMLYNAERVDEAVEVLDQAKQRGLFTEARDYDQLARMLLGAGHEARAASVVREGMDSGLLEANYSNYSMLGQALYFSDDYAGAAEAWASAAETAPDGEMAFNAARAYLDAEDWEAAVRWGNRALEQGVRNPDNVRAVIHNANLELGR